MYALDNDSGVKTMPEIKSKKFEPADTHWFTEGGNGVAPSYPGADWFNIVQAELLNILTDAGMTPDKGQFNQITQAIRAIVSASVKTSLNDKAPIASPIFTGTPKAPTPAQTVNDTTVATTAYVRAAIAALVGTAPATLDTLSEIANALAGDANVKATLLAEIGKKANASHTHTANQITDFNQATSQIINAAITYQKIGDFEVRKYPDGTMIQTYAMLSEYNRPNNKKEYSFNWAVAFVSKPIIHVSTETSWANNEIALNISSDNGHTTNTKTTYWLWEERYQDGIIKLNFTAIGRWK